MRRVGELVNLGMVVPAGLRAFAARKEERSGVYSFEPAGVCFEPEQEALFRARAVAWAFFQTQPAWYRRTATWRVVSAKREETRAPRLAGLIENSAPGRTIAELTRASPAHSGSVPE